MISSSVPLQVVMVEERADELVIDCLVAERIVAPPGSKTYGRLSVLAGWRAEAKILFDIAPRAFVPAPQVTSSVVRLVPRPEPLPCDRRLLERVAEAAFGQRRKMLRQSLKSLGVEGVASVRQGKVFDIELSGSDKRQAEVTLKEAADKLLANTVIENYRIEVTG